MTNRRSAAFCAPRWRRRTIASRKPATAKRRWIFSSAITVDLIVLDLGLPGMDGLEVVRRLRAAAIATPIVILSSRDDEAGKVAALDLGADDYVTKPFGVEELSARIRAALRHRLQQEGEKPLFRSGDLAVDLVRRIVTVRGRRR